MSLQDKLKEVSMDLHDKELQVFQENIQVDGTFKTKQGEDIFREVGKTRKQVEQLLYILERYEK